MEKLYPADGIIIRACLGLYISVPFCRTKCSYCNFASDVFSRACLNAMWIGCAIKLRALQRWQPLMGGKIEREVESVYLGGGTPTVLGSDQLQRILAAIREHFSVVPRRGITVECAPGTLTSAMLVTLVGCGVNCVEPGVQSFVDARGGRGRTPAQARDGVRRHRALTRRRNREYQYRSDRRTAPSDGRKLARLSRERLLPPALRTLVSTCSKSMKTRGWEAN